MRHYAADDATLDQLFADAAHALLRDGADGDGSLVDRINAWLAPPRRARGDDDATEALRAAIRIAAKATEDAVKFAQAAAPRDASITELTMKVSELASPPKPVGDTVNWASCMLQWNDYACAAASLRASADVAFDREADALVSAFDALGSYLELAWLGASSSVRNDFQRAAAAANLSGTAAAPIDQKMRQLAEEMNKYRRKCDEAYPAPDAPGIVFD